MSSLDICRPAEVVGEVWRRYTLQTLVDEKGELIVNDLVDDAVQIYGKTMIRPY